MRRKIGLMLAVFLTVSPRLYSQDGVLAPQGYDPSQDQWLRIDADMSPDQYRDALRHNRHVARSKIAHSIVSLGVPKAGADLVGIAVAAAVDDLKLPLNKSETLTLRIEDATGGDRSAFIRFKIDW